MPEGIEGVVAGNACPHNAYAQNPDVFANRDAVGGIIERLLRLISTAELGLLSEKDMDPLSVTELLIAKAETGRQQQLREKRAFEKARLESEMNKERPNMLPGAMGDVY